MALSSSLRPHGSVAWGLVMAGVAAILFSGKAIVAKLLYQHGTDALQVLSLRLLFTLPFSLLALWWSGRGRERLSASTHKQLILLGFLGYYLSSLLDFSGLQYVSVGLERLTLFLGPAIVLVLGSLFFDRPSTRAQWLAMMVAYAGVALVFQHDLAQGGNAVGFGTSLVFGAAVSYSLYLLLAGDLVRQLGSLRLVAWALLYSTAMTLAHFLIARPPAELAQPWPVYGLSMINATLCTVIPVYLTMRAVACIGPGASAQMGMLGPVSLLPLGYFLLDEPVSTIQLAGTALVLSGIGLLARLPQPQPITSSVGPQAQAEFKPD